MYKILLTLTILISVNSLLGMEHDIKKETQPSPITLPQVYYHFSQNLLEQDVNQQIFSIYCDVTIEKIKQSSKYSERFVRCIETLISACGEWLVSELCECFFVREKISICDIKNECKQTSLHVCTNPKVTQILLRVAGDNAFKLLTMQSSGGWTALHGAVLMNRTEIVKIILNAVGDNAQDLIVIEQNDRKTALDIAKPKIKEIMQKYMTNKK